MYPSATISFADLYGAIPPGRKTGETAAADTQQASGSVGGSESKNPAYFWAAFVGALFIVRVLWERGK